MIVPRNQWCDTPRRSVPARIPLPAPAVWLHHGASGTSSIRTARAYARFHIVNRGWQDIGYSFVIAEGRVLEGRGAGRSGGHTSGHNSTSHGICVAGDYTSRDPDPADLDALRWLLAHGTEQGWWPTPTITGGHRQAPGASTTCPGRLVRFIPSINQGDDMTPADRELLQKAAADAAEARRLAAEVVTSLAGRHIGNDLQRLRVTSRAIAHAAGLPTEHPVPDGPVPA